MIVFPREDPLGNKQRIIVVSKEEESKQTVKDVIIIEAKTKMRNSSWIRELERFSDYILAKLLD